MQAPPSYQQVDNDVLAPLQAPGRTYFQVVALLAAGVAALITIWVYQMKIGMGVTGLNHPVGWAVYIGNFVFWVGIAHSGTLISAILHLVRSRWRAAVSRSAEAMTIFAILTAGLFPLIHLGRTWVFYFILPYPSQRRLWPNFVSPLIFDVLAVTTYLIVSTIFFYVGLFPDLAAARDRSERENGPHHPRTRFYRRLALGWSGSWSQWRHYTRSYLFFAAFATPLVVSVHSVVSWDFALGILPGWHTTIFPPYFVAGAIHSGLAMVLTLTIPMRSLLGLKRMITVDHYDMIGRTMLVTTAIVGYTYVVEPFTAWYSGNIFERQFSAWRATSPIAWGYWPLIFFNVLVPATFIWRRARRSIAWAFVASILVNIGMWLERVVIVAGATAHDFLPHNWGPYFPRWPESCITGASFAFFLFFFVLFARTLPTVAIADVKEHRAERALEEGGPLPGPSSQPAKLATWSQQGVVATFEDPALLVKAAGALRDAGYTQLDAFSPYRLPVLDKVLGLRGSPVWVWTLLGALAGLAGGFGLAIGAAKVNNLRVGGKFPVSLIPYCIPGFEGLILIGSLTSLAGLLIHARLGPTRLPPAYRQRFGADRSGLLVACPPHARDEVMGLLAPFHPEEVHVLGA